MPPQTQTVKTATTGQPNTSRRGSRQHRGQGDTPRNQPVSPPLQVAQQIEDKEEGETEDLDSEEDSCWICAEPVKYYSVSECNHRTCHICAVRLRALYKKFECTFCKADQPDAIFTKSPDQLYETFDKKKFIYKDPKLAILFETREMMEDTLPLLRYNCPDLKCEYIAAGWADLKAHVRAVHGRMLCDLCTRTKKIFTYEHTLYNPDQLAIHLPSLRRYESTAGNKARGEQIEGGIHPFCDFCREALYGEDEHFAHMRERHEECFVCKSEGVFHEYFQNYQSLEKHFSSKHFPCTHADCVAQKFVVFASALDLKAHMVERHGESMSSKDLKDARRVDANFAFEEIGRGRGRVNARDRERDAERERERERDRQRNQAEAQASAESSAQARRRQAFNGLLSTGNESGSSTATPTQQPSNTLFLDREDLDPLTREKHAAFIARASTLTGDSANAMTAIRSAVRSYRASEAPAKDLVNTFFNVLNQNSDSTGILVNGLVEIFEDEEKKQALLEAWNSFRVERREQFPAIVPTGVGTEYAGVTGGRILNIKHRTRGPSRSVWDRVEQAATSSAPRPLPPLQTRAAKPKPSASPFPSLATSPPGAAGPAGSLPPHSSTAWSLHGGPVAPPSSSKIVLVPSEPRPAAGGRGGNLSSKQHKPPQIRNESAFPVLPPSSNPPRNVSKDAISGNQSLKNIKGEIPPSTSAWGAGGGASSSPAAGATQSDAGNPAASDAPPEARGKKKGKGKQTLFTTGLRHNY